ncbi:MAG: protein kinase [Acidobacteriota bacterium]
MEKQFAQNVSGILGSYRILSTLGRGGMGEVYLAEDSRLGRRVALKLLPSDFTNDPDRLARFEREARAASALNHPNILTIYEVGSFDGRQFIAAEYVEGESLRQRQVHSRLKLNEVLEMTIQVASALAAAHQAGIVHRDIKPDNIMLRPDGYAKVVDFGLAKLTEKSKSGADTSMSTMLQVDTGTGVVMGTTAYMSPEQARGLELDARTDIWSLGVVLYEMLSGSMPFKGNTQSDLVVSILERDPAPLITTPLLPPELDWMVRKTLRKDREERYQSARELLGDLRGLKQQLDFAAQHQRSIQSGPQAETISGEAAIVVNADVIPAAVKTDASRIVPTAQLEPAATGIQQPGKARSGALRTVLIAGGLAILVIGLIGVAYKLWPAKKTPPFASMKIIRITNSGKVIDSIISPDGKYIVYALSDAGKQSLWIRQLSIANDKVIVPPAPGGIFGIAFSRDGNDVYYALKQNLDSGTLYRIPTLGGTPVKILEGIDSPVSFSPDGKQLVLSRGNFPNLGESALVIANVDGSSERTLAVRKPPEHFAPIFFAGPSWSPDGKLIAASVARIAAPSSVLAFAVSDGKETDLTPATPWRLNTRVKWLPDMSGLLVVAGESGNSAQVWFLSYPGGEVHRITNDLNIYRSIGISGDGRKLVTIQSSGVLHIWIAPEGDAGRATQLPTGNLGFFGSGSNLCWTPDGGIVFVSNESGNLDLLLIDSAGQNRKQLTSNAGQNTNPTVSRDGRFVVFASTRSGQRGIWRIDIDGNNPRRLSNGLADALPAISPDGKWVVYSSLAPGKPNLWKVSIEGGNAVQITDNVAVAPSISPDGKYISYIFPTSPDPFAPPNRIAVIPFEGGEPLKIFEFPVGGTVSPSAQWSPDGRAIMYTVNSNNVTNLWSQPLDGGPPKQITEFKDSLMTGFAWSRDGKTLAATRGTLTRDAVLISESE